jgi:hypothetical protein
MVRRRGVSPCVRRGLCSSRIPMDWGTGQQFSDSRSNFHTRVGYRTNVCRRRLASDLARASEGTPAQGALEDHHDRLPGSPLHRARSSFVLLNFSDGTRKPKTHMNEVRNTKLYYALLSVGGVISFLITAWGCLASLGLDYRKPTELSLAMCFILPFPCFLLSMRSIRWSATSLWALFVGLWILRAFTISPNPQLNPVDTLGAAFLCPAVAVQLAALFKPKYTAPAG